MRSERLSVLQRAQEQESALRSDNEALRSSVNRCSFSDRNIGSSTCTLLSESQQAPLRWQNCS